MINLCHNELKHSTINLRICRRDVSFADSLVRWNFPEKKGWNKHKHKYKTFVYCVNATQGMLAFCQKHFVAFVHRQIYMKMAAKCLRLLAAICNHFTLSIALITHFVNSALYINVKSFVFLFRERNLPCIRFADGRKWKNLKWNTFKFAFQRKKSEQTGSLSGKGRGRGLVFAQSD